MSATDPQPRFGRRNDDTELPPHREDVPREEPAPKPDGVPFGYKYPAQ